MRYEFCEIINYGVFMCVPGAQINVKDCDDNTPLHLAALNGQTSIMSFLIECGANIYMYVV